MVSFILNGACKELAVAAETPLLWALREHLQLTGTKFGCGVASCGACTVHVDGAPVRCCVTTLAMVEGRSVVAIPHLGAVHESGRGPTRKLGAMPRYVRSQGRS